MDWTTTTITTVIQNGGKGGLDDDDDAQEGDSLAVDPPVHIKSPGYSTLDYNARGRDERELIIGLRLGRVE